MHEHFPVAIFGETLIDCFPDKKVLGGAPFNVARHLQAFGYPALLFSRIGQDEEGKMLRQAMADWALSTIGIQEDGIHTTGRVDIRFEGEKHYFDILPSQAYDYIDAIPLKDCLTNIQPVISYFGSLAQRNEVSKAGLEHFLNANSNIHFLDINLRAPWYDLDVIRQSLQQADIVKMNDEELHCVLGLLGFDSASAEDSALKLMHHYGIKQFVVTCGSAGAWALDEQAVKHQLEISTLGQASKSSILDTVGAGDAFAAVYIIGLLQNWPIKQALERAHHFAGAICRIRGAVPENKNLYRSYMESWVANG